MIPIPFLIFIQQRLSLVIGVVNRAICNTFEVPANPRAPSPAPCPSIDRPPTAKPGQYYMPQKRSPNDDLELSARGEARVFFPRVRAKMTSGMCRSGSCIRSHDVTIADRPTVDNPLRCYTKGLCPILAE